MRGLVLAGGRGRRLAPFTTVFPKPLAPVGDVPILEVVLRQLRWHGVRRATISIGYLGELVQAYLTTRGGIPGLEIDYLRETAPLGTAGPLGLLGEREEDVLAINGDVLSTFDFSAFVAAHARERPALTVAVQPRVVPVDFGVVETDAAGEVVGWVEKPRHEYLCGIGIYAVSPRATAVIGPGEALDMPDLVGRLLAAGERVVSYRADCSWLDIGRREDYEQAQEAFVASREAYLPDEA